MAGSTMAGIPALKDVYQQLKSRMDKAVEDFRLGLAATRTGRASVHMLEQVKVQAYGTEMPAIVEPAMIVFLSHHALGLRGYCTGSPGTEPTCRSRAGCALPFLRIHPPAQHACFGAQ